MSAIVNAHRAFYGTDSVAGYRQALQVSDNHEKTLRSARDDIRNHLQSSFIGMEKSSTLNGLFGPRLAMDSAFRSAVKLRPKFYMQGSYVYKTLNKPAKAPKQKIDFDDGMYLPTSFIRDNGRNGMHPALLAKGYFDAVEASVAPLCKQKNWRLVTDKESCVRIVVLNDAHIDIPLYAIPDDEFASLQQRILQKTTDSSIAQDVALNDMIYRDLDPNNFMLAQRTKGWIPSDPRKIESWFQQAVRVHDEVLRRVCRYVKGWRDHQWEQPKLTSLAIMAAVIDVFNEFGGDVPANRDDQALLLVAQRLPQKFAAKIPNPVISGQYLDASWSVQDRADIVSKTRELAAHLEAALTQNYGIFKAIEHFTSAFGSRFPQNMNLIHYDSAEAEILSYPAVKTSAPAVHRTTSG